MDQRADARPAFVAVVSFELADGAAADHARADIAQHWGMEVRALMRGGGEEG